MSYLTEANSWDDVYQLDTTDFVKGGAGGAANVPLQNLTNRTTYLKTQIAAIIAGTTPFTGAPAAPTPAQFDNSTKLATTAFVQRAGGNFRAGYQLTADTTLTQANAGGIYQVTGAYTITLPTISAAAQSGINFTLFSNASDWRLSSPTANISCGNGVVSTIVIPKWSEVHITTTDNGAWYVLGSAFAGEAPQFDASASTATTAFVQRALGNRSAILPVSATTTLDPSYWGRLIPVNCTAASQVITLPSAALAGLQIQFQNWGSYDVTITAPTGLLITAGGNSATQTFHAGSSCTITWDGANYFMEGVLVGTPPQFANGFRIANTAFVQQALGNFSAGKVVSGAVALTAAQAGSALSVNGGTITLPAFSSVLSGASFLIQATAQTTINLTGSDTLWQTGPGSVSSLILYTGDWAIITAVGQWEVEASSVSAGTAPQFDSSWRTANTAFVQRAIGNRSSVLGVSASMTIPASMMGGYVVVNGATSSITLTLQSTGIKVGSELLLANITAYDCTISTGSSSLYTYGPGLSFATTCALRAGTSCVATWDGSNWIITSSDTCLTPGASDNSNRIATTAYVKNNSPSTLTGPGYQKLPSGLIIQWGTAAASYTGNGATNAVSVTMPTTFPNVMLIAYATFLSPQGGCSAGCYNYATSSLTVAYANLSGANLTMQATWLAIGY